VNRFPIILVLSLFFFYCASHKKSNVDSILESNAAYYGQQGDLAFQMRNYDRAINLYKQAIHLYRGQPTHFLNIGACFLQLEQPDSAIVYLKEALDLKPDYFYAHMNMAKSFLQKEQLDTALQITQQAREINPDSFDLWRLTAQIHKKKNDFDAASSALARAIILRPDDAHLYHELGMLYYQESLQHEAIEQYDKAIRVDSTFAAAWFSRGNAFARLCLLDKAESSYLTSIQYNPRMFGAFNNLGILYMHQEKHLEAIHQFNRALQIDSSAAPVMLNLSISLQHLDSPNVALNLVNNAIKRDSSFAMFYFQKGNILLQLGQSLQAKQAYIKAMQLDPDFALIYNNLGNSLFELDDLDDASRMYQRALELYPEYLKGRLESGEKSKSEFTNLLAACIDPAELTAEFGLMLFNLGKAQLLLENEKAAVTYLKQAVTIIPHFHEAFLLLASIYQQNNQTENFNEMMAQANLAQAKAAIDADELEQAINFCRQAIDFDKNSADAYAELGRLFYEKQDSIRAEQYFDTAFALDSANTNAFLYKGIYYTSRNKLEIAQSMFSSVLDNDADNIVAHQNLAHIYDVLGDSKQAEHHKAVVHAARGSAFQNIRQWESAYESFKKAASLDPENADYQAELGLIALKKQDTSHAQAYFTKALAINPEHIQALYGSGLLAGYRQNYQQAIENFLAVLKQDNEFMQAHFAIANMYAQNGDKEKARHHAEIAKQAGLYFSKEFWNSIE